MPLREVPVDHHLARRAQRAYMEELHRRFGFAPGPLDAPEPGATYVVATAGIHPVAYGGIRPAVGHEDAIIEGAAEVKRMWVHPDWRGAGLGARVLSRLEELAAARGCAQMILDTNGALKEAISLYGRAGYQRIQRYNDNSEAELFFAKDLS
ncbi:hypothetical protein GCM10009674_21390 [Nesterenkonia xinjiangensis]